VRLGADFTFLRRSFTTDMVGRDPFTEVPRLLEAVAALQDAPPAEAADHRARFVAAVDGGPVEPARVREPAVVALHA